MSEGDENPKKENKSRARGVFERPKRSGTWWVRYTDENGRLHREKVGTKALALKVYQKRKNEVQERRFFPERIGRRDVLLADFIDQYLDTVKAKASYTNRVHYAALWKAALKGKTLRQVLPGDVERYKAQRVKDLAPATVNRELAFLKRVFNVAIQDGLADTNPVRRVKLFVENNARTRYLTNEEETRLRETIGEEHWPFVAVAIHTGLRQSEQLKLKWETVDFTSGSITVPKSKHGKARHVPMNDTVRTLLRDLPSRLKSAYVFPSATGETPLDGRNLMNRVFLPALTRAEIQGLRWHDLRHTFASRLVMAGVDLRTVQDLLGHKTMAMTERYSHLSPAHQLDAVQRLNQKPTDTATDTKPADIKTAVGESGKVVEFPEKESAPGVIRTLDLQIRSLPL